MANFGTLFNYSAKSGVVIPQTSSIKGNIETAFREIFGSDFSLDASTTNGRLIEALTLMFVDTVGVNAQNANGLNIEQAVGAFLDNLGAVWGIVRATDESDGAYRKRVLMSASRGSGFASSISNELAKVSGVTKVVVLDNGNEDPAVLPVDSAGRAYDHSIPVDAHSVFISVLGGSDADIIAAIERTKSAGCGFTNNSDYGTYTNGYYRPTQRYLKVEVNISQLAYTGTDIITDAKAAIKKLTEDNSINSTITKDMVFAALASNGLGIVGTACTLKVSDTSPTLVTDTSIVDKVIVPPYKFLNVSDALIIPTVVS